MGYLFAVSPPFDASPFSCSIVFGSAVYSSFAEFSSSYIFAKYIIGIHYFYIMKTIPIITNISKNGNSIKNHDRPGTPALQIKLRIQVHNNTYINLIMKITKTLDTEHE
jgi:hypothetical protein